MFKNNERCLRILLLIDSAFPYDGGGRETGMFHIGKYGSGVVDIRAITLARPHNIAEPQFPDASHYFKFYPVFSLRGRCRIRGYDKCSRFLDNIFFSVQAFEKAQTVCQRWCPDVVLCVHAGPLALTAIKLSRQFGALSVLNMRSFYVEELKHVSSLHKPFLTYFRNVEKRVIKEIDLVLANGEDTFKSCKTDYKRTNPVELVHNGVDTGHFKPSNQHNLRKELGIENHIVFISNNPMRAIKGPQDAISAIARMPETIRSNCRILFFGDGPESNFFREHARRLNVESLIRWLPKVKHENLPLYLRASDIALHPILFSAGTTHASLESIACGLPQISYDSASLCSTCIDGKTGILVKTGDIDGLAKAMTELAINKKLRQAMASASREWSLQFDWSAYVTRYIELIHNNTRKKT